MKLIVGSDHFGWHLKELAREILGELGHEVVDAGCAGPEGPVDYPDVAEAVAVRVAASEFERGILVCGTGIGMAMVANKVPGVRAACCHDPYSARRARMSNDAQILCLGEQIVGPALARILIEEWIAAEFAGGRSAPKVAKIIEIDERYRRAR